MDSVDTSIPVAVATQKRDIMWKPALRDRASALLTATNCRLSPVALQTINDISSPLTANRLAAPRKGGFIQKQEEAKSRSNVNEILQLITVCNRHAAIFRLSRR